jgi:hypothetical protein
MGEWRIESYIFLAVISRRHGVNVRADGAVDAIRHSETTLQSHYPHSSPQRLESQLRWRPGNSVQTSSGTRKQRSSRCYTWQLLRSTPNQEPGLGEDKP